jgi:hypothetical protein
MTHKQKLQLNLTSDGASLAAPRDMSHEAIIKWLDDAHYQPQTVNSIVTR